VKIKKRSGHGKRRQRKEPLLRKESDQPTGNILDLKEHFLIRVPARHNARLQTIIDRVNGDLIPITAIESIIYRNISDILLKKNSIDNTVKKIQSEIEALMVL
jgi:hypothetical protein